MTIQEQFYKELGRIIREKRAGRQVSQYDLSRKTQVSKRAISSIENGGRISEDNLESLLSFFDIKLSLTLRVIEENNTELQHT